MIATGLCRYNVHEKTVSSFRQQGSAIVYLETPFTGTVLSRGYATELVRVSVYSESPKVWAEELSPDVVHFFVQNPQQAEAT
jgi:hypothetical protein